jgi:branched-chain amino acid transport system permease protein
LSLIKTPIGLSIGAFYGTVALLFAALIIIRLMPNGVSAGLQRLAERLPIFGGR